MTVTDSSNRLELLLQNEPITQPERVRPAPVKARAKVAFLTGFDKFITETEFLAVEVYVWLECSRNWPLFICICLILYLGLRRTEACTIKVDDFKDDFTRLVFVPLKQKKTLERAIPFFLTKLLRRYYAAWKDRLKDGYLCTPYYGLQKNAHIMPATVNHFFAKMREDLGIDDDYYKNKKGQLLHRFTPHTIRHYFLDKLRELTNGNAVLCQQIIGHAKLETTVAYFNKSAKRSKERELIELAWKA